MTNETKDRIGSYRREIPQMRGKVLAAVMMMVVAMIMTVSVTFAWMTLSAAPEVVSIDTTVTANGSLEIALANSDKAPQGSARGDSSGYDGNVLRANNTWGNLVNLSDPSYGLSNITLRPAALNGTSGLLTNPLKGVAYGEDGRVSAMTTEDDFAYCYYDKGNETTTAAFLVDESGTHYGVRAISTVQYQNLEGDSALRELNGNAKRYLSTAQGSYHTMTDQSKEPGKSYVASIEGLMQVYAQSKVNGKLSELRVDSYVSALYEMMTYMRDNVMEQTGNAYLELANMCELIDGSGNANSGYTIDSLCAAARSNTLPSHIDIPSLKQFAQDRYNLGIYTDENPTEANKKKSLYYWKLQAEGGVPVYWTDIQTIINWVVDINNCTIDGYKMSELSGHLNSLAGSGTKDAKINSGAIYRVEQRIGERMSPTVAITVKGVPIVGTASVNAVVTTSASDPWEIPNDIAEVTSRSDGSFKGTDAVAEDTYAMAIDLWVRTNAGSVAPAQVATTEETDENGNKVITTVTTASGKAYLTLEGNVILERREVEAFVTDINGDEQEAYTASYEGDSVDVFLRQGGYYFLQIDESGKAVGEISVEDYLKENNVDPSSVTYTRKVTLQDVVVDYQGVNRVWSEDQMAEFEGVGGISTTQGSGSCYVFYADNEADQSRFLELLGAMKVVFVDSNGRQIGYANMDTEHYYALNGRVTIPLKLDERSAIDLGSDINGKEITGLMPLEKNAATRVTALVYLDGRVLTNDMVLASGDIQGMLNVQFGSVMASSITTVKESKDGTTTKTEYVVGDPNTSIRDEELMDDFITISAEVDGGTEFEYDPDNLPSVALNVQVDGIQADSVTARFVRAINSTQGALQPPFALTEEDNGWTGSYTFQHPGTYILRSVWVDGVERALTDQEPITVTVKGVSVRNLSCSDITDGTGRVTIMTADASHVTTLALGFTTSAQTPKRVRGIFLDANGRQVTATFKQDKTGTNWIGTAEFASSGTFTMKYVEIDGEQYEIDESQQPTLELLLGLRVRTWISASEETIAKLKAINPDATATRFTLDPGGLNITGQPDGDVTLQITAMIYDNSGAEIKSLSGAELIYGRAGSATKKLDTNLRWNAEQSRYTGTFLVTQAGTYSFTKVTVGSNTISTALNAPGIQAMPPDDASYFDNHTEAEQTIISGTSTAKAVLGIAYSSAATKVEAEIVKADGTSAMVDGKQMSEDAEHQGDKSVTLWEFAIPSINGNQEGNWTVFSITMYGVYYNGRYYDEDSGAVVDLRSEKITARVVQNVYVTLSGTSNTSLTGYFMDDHEVDDMTVTIADFEGKPLAGIVSDVKVVYQLDYNNVTENEYGYSADPNALAGIDVSSTGATQQSDTVYSVTGLNFMTAGDYRGCAVSFALDGRSYTAGSSGNTRIGYKDGGRNSETCPRYTVHWIAPTVKIVGTKPAADKEFDINVDSRGGTNLTRYTVKNYHEVYYANVYMKVDTFLSMATGYTLPEVTFALSNAGSKISANNSASFVIPNNSGTAYANTVTFTSVDNVSSDIGGLEGSSRRQSGTVKVTDITMNYGGTAYSLKLSNELTIRETNQAYPTIEYIIPSEYAQLFVKPTGKTGSDGREIRAELPKLTAQKTVEVGVGADTRTTYEYTQIKQPIKWSVTTGSGCEATTTNYTGYKTTTTKETVISGMMAEALRTYTISKWEVSSTTVNDAPKTTTRTYNSGATLLLSTNTNVATAIVTTSDAITGEPYEGTVRNADKEVTAYLDFNGREISEPSGASNNGKATTYTWTEDTAGNVISGTKP